MENSLTLHSLQKAASKTRRMLFMIRWSFAELSVSLLAPIYNTLVRLHRQYAMQACSANLLANADCLGQIQRLATRLVKGFHQLPYKERLRQLGLHSLRRRRLRGELIVVYKMFSRELDPDPSLFFIPPVWPGLRGHPFKVLQDPSRRQVVKY